MSKQCPHCGHYNTESKISGNLGYVAVQGLRFGAAMVAAAAVGAFNRSAGHAAGHTVIHNTESWGNDIKRYHCCNCGKDF